MLISKFKRAWGLTLCVISFLFLLITISSLLGYGLSDSITQLFLPDNSQLDRNFESAVYGTIFLLFAMFGITIYLLNKPFKSRVVLDSPAYQKKPEKLEPVSTVSQRVGACVRCSKKTNKIESNLNGKYRSDYYVCDQYPNCIIQR